MGGVEREAGIHSPILEEAKTRFPPGLVENVKNVLCFSLLTSEEVDFHFLVKIFEGNDSPKQTINIGLNDTAPLL